MESSASKSLQLFIQSPDLPLPTKSLTLPVSSSPITTSHLLSLLRLPSSLQTLIPSLYFTLNGRPLSPSLLLPSSSTLLLRLRLPGGGGDGGSTCAESRDCYLNMYSSKKPDKVDPNEARLSKFTTCSLSNEPLNPPIVVDRLGNLFNKEALVQALIHKKQLPKEFAHVRGLKDMIEVKIPNFECPITGLEFNGKYGFFAIRKCGHVLSVKSVKEVRSEGKCLVCGEMFEERDKIVINGSEEEVKVLREWMEDEDKGRVKVKKEKKKKVEGLKRSHDGGEKVGGEKRFRAIDIAPANATKEVYASIFTSSRKGELKETYSCRSLPLGRN